MTTATRSNSPGRLGALTDIVIVVIASAAAFAVEVAAAERLPWGIEARGVVAVLVGATVAILVTLRRGGTLADLGFRRPARWSTVPLWAIGILGAYVVAQGVAPVFVAPFFELPEPDMSRYDVIRGNLPSAAAFALLLPLTAAIPEEIVYRGFLIERLMRLIGEGPTRAVLAVLVQALMFGAVHFQWGFGGIIVTSIMGFVWGIGFLLCGRNLWIVIIAHSAGHVAMIAQLYLSQPTA